MGTPWLGLLLCRAGEVAQCRAESTLWSRGLAAEWGTSITQLQTKAVQLHHLDIFQLLHVLARAEAGCSSARAGLLPGGSGLGFSRDHQPGCIMLMGLYCPRSGASTSRAPLDLHVPCTCATSPLISCPWRSVSTAREGCRNGVMNLIKPQPFIAPPDMASFHLHPLGSACHL